MKYDLQKMMYNWNWQLEIHKVEASRRISERKKQNNLKRKQTAFKEFHFVI